MSVLELLTLADVRSSPTSITGEAHVVGEETTNYVWLVEVPATAASVTISGFTRVSGTPSSGEFRVITEGDWAGALEFNAANAGAVISVDYSGSGSPIAARDNNRVKSYLRSGVGYHFSEFGGSTANTGAENDAVLAAIYAEAVSYGVTVGFDIIFGAGTFKFDANNMASFSVPNVRWLGRRGGQTIFQKDPSGTFNGSNTAHMFYDRTSSGATDGLEVHGIWFDLSRSSATPGSDLVSAFFFDRINGLRFTHCRFFDGIEEGLKLYKCQDVIVEACTFSNIRNNGMQNHAPKTADENYGGGRSNQGIKDVFVRWTLFEDIDDGRGGSFDGEGITFNSTDTTIVCENMYVDHCTFVRCIRGIWTEINPQSGVAPVVRNLQYTNCYVRNSISHGAAMVGVTDSAMVNIHVVDPGADPVDISSSTNATPIVVTTASAHGYNQGQRIKVDGHTHTAANGLWYIDVLSSTTFALYTNPDLTGGAVGTTTGGASGTVSATTSSETFGLYIGGSGDLPSERVQIIGGSAVDTRATPQMDYAVRIQQCDDCAVHSVSMRGASEQLFWVSASTTTNLRISGISPLPMCSVRLTSQTIGTASDTPIEWNSSPDYYDPYGMHDPSSNEERITPQWLGQWKAKCHAAFYGNSTGFRRLRLYYKDIYGQTLVDFDAKDALSDTGEEINLQVESPWIEWEDGYWFQANVYQTSGGDLGLYPAGCWMEVEFDGVFNPT